MSTTPFNNSTIQFVNIDGQPVDTLTGRVKLARVSKAKTEFHKGWRVVGVPPAAQTEAIALAKLKFKLDFNLDLWSANARARSVRAKPYEIPEAAATCAELARAAGWKAVKVVEIKNGAAA